MDYRKNVEDYLTLNLRELGTSYSVNWRKVKELDNDAFDMLAEEYGIDPGFAEGEWVWMSEDCIEDMGIPYEAVDYSDSFFDEGDRDYVLDQIIKPADHYLVWASNCTWDGSTGYKIADSIEDALYRSYDSIIRPSAATKGGKVLECVESSHDVPMGSLTYVIALTEREYDWCSDWNRDFKDIKQFVEKRASKLERSA